MAQETLTSNESRDRHDNIEKAIKSGKIPILAIEGYLHKDVRTSDEIFTNPDPEDPRVTLGSLITVKYSSDGHDATYLVLGRTKEFPAELAEGMGLPEGARCMPIDTPLIRQDLLGKEAGYQNDHFRHDVKGRGFNSIKLIAVDNTFFEV